jgi:hypothetical protein
VHLAASDLGGPRAADRHAPPAEDSKAGSSAVARPDAIWEVAPLRADPLRHLLVHHLADDEEAGRAAERHQAVSGRAGELGQTERRDPGSRLSRSASRSRRVAAARGTFLLDIGGGSLPSVSLVGRPNTYQMAEVRRGTATKTHTVRDYLCIDGRVGQ